MTSVGQLGSPGLVGRNAELDRLRALVDPAPDKARVLGGAGRGGDGQDRAAPTLRQIGLLQSRRARTYNAGCPAALSDHGRSPGYGIASLPRVPPWSTTVSPPMVRVNSSWMAYTYSPDSQAQAGLLMNGTMRMS